MPFLNARERRTLALICDTLIPTLEPEADDDARLFRLKASDLDIAAQLELAAEQVTDAYNRRLLKLFLNAIENSATNYGVGGTAQAFTQLGLEERSGLLRSWGGSRLPLARRAFQAVKRLALAIFYATMPEGKPNPTWPVFNYGDPPGPASDAPHTIRPLEIAAPTALYTDVVIIGSGAGGGVVAGELSAAGLDVIVVEKGGYHAERDFHGRERASSESMYERRGVLATDDLGFVVLAGSTLGGGTTINWTTSLRTPQHVLHEWANEYGFAAAVSADYERSFEAVEQRINVNLHESAANAQNAALERGCKALGYAVEALPRNVRGCEDCGFCSYGCPFGAKQSTLKTYLQDAYDRGARIVVNAHVDRILYRHGVAQGVEMTVDTAAGNRQRVVVYAKVVVAAAGAIHTPALLIRSGLGNAHIGANLHLHPATVIFSRFDEATIPWSAAPQTRVATQFSNLDGRGYGVLLEVAPAHPGMSAQAFPWRSGREHKRNMQRLDHYSNIVILNRDNHGGQIKVDRAGQPVLHYRLNRYDARHLMVGIVEALKIHRAAGANLIYSPHQRLEGWTAGSNGSFEHFAEAVAAEAFETNAIALFSAHQMSTCRIAASSAAGAISPAGESYEVRNLFVADGSVLPTAPGVNPMLSIMAAAHHIAQHIKARF